MRHFPEASMRHFPDYATSIKAELQEQKNSQELIYLNLFR